MIPTPLRFGVGVVGARDVEQPYREELDAMRSWVRFDPDMPGSERMALEANQAHNVRVAKRIRARGLFPRARQVPSDEPAVQASTEPDVRFVSAPTS